jgi:hypothetical protein
MARLRAAAGAGGSANAEFPVIDGEGRRAWHAVQAHALQDHPG